jgi:hypothetical protein
LCHALLGDARLFQQLLRFDEDLAARVRASGCPCGGRLHSARFPRKPRGGLVDVEGYDYRLSFCCDREGCRSRMTPPSLRFLGRRVYLGAVVVLVSAMMRGLTSWRVAALCRLVGADRRTLERWRRWWQEVFPSTPLWRDAKARFMPPVEESALPASLLKGFAGSRRAQLVGVLKLLLPATTSPWSSMVTLGPQRTLGEGRDRAR